MLVLSRKKNESILINDQIVITVIEIRGDKVRLGIQAPADVTIHREEVYEALKRAAAEQAPGQPQSEVAVQSPVQDQPQTSDHPR